MSSIDIQKNIKEYFEMLERENKKYCHKCFDYRGELQEYKDIKDTYICEDCRYMEEFLKEISYNP